MVSDALGSLSHLALSPCRGTINSHELVFPFAPVQAVPAHPGRAKLHLKMLFLPPVNNHTEIFGLISLKRKPLRGFSLNILFY